MRFSYLIFLFLVQLLRAQEFSILEYGAKPIPGVLNTLSIQNAIDKAHANGGGRVIIPEGVFLTGSIILRSNVELHLEGNAVLLGSTNPGDYLSINRWKALILADQQSHISITGKGTIDGQGRNLALHIDSLFYAGKIDSTLYNFVEMRPSHYIRPQIIEFVKCNRININGVTVKNAACWVQTYDQCQNLVIDNIRVESDAYWNNDGIDIQDCKNVRITNSFVNSADDGICLKSQSPDFYCDSIYISDCTVRSSASAIKFGTVSHGGFKNVIIENIKVFDTFRSAIAIECVDGGILENVLVQNIQALNTGNAIFIRLGNRSAARAPGILKNVVIRNMRAEIPFERPDYQYEIRGPALPFFHNIFPSSITGIPGHKVENVILENIQLIYPGRGNNGLANMPFSRLQDVPEKEKAYPEFSMFGELPSWGLYVRHMDGLTMKNVTLSITSPDYRPAIVFDDVHNLEMHGIKIEGDNKPIQIVLNRTTDVNIESSEGVMKCN